MDQDTRPYVLRGSRWRIGIVTLLTGACALLSVSYVVLNWSTMWDRPGKAVPLILLAAALVLCATMTGWVWARNPHSPPRLYVDGRGLRLRVAPQQMLDLSWEEVRRIEIARRSLGLVVSVEPVNPDLALAKLPGRTRLPERLGGARRPGDRVVTSVPLTATSIEELQAALGRFAAGRSTVVRAVEPGPSVIGR